MLSRSSPVDPKELKRSFWYALVGVALVSGLLNLLMLTGSIYMLEIYDRVVPSRSIPTLLGLTAIVVILYAFQGFLEFARSRVLVNIGASVDDRLSGAVFQSVLQLPLMRSNGGEGLLPLRDLDQVRSFFGGSGLPAMFDLPWVPLYLGICFLFHPLIGTAVAIGGCILFGLTLLTELLSKSATHSTTLHGTERFASAESARRNADVVRAMGLSTALTPAWQRVNEQYVSAQLRISNIAGAFGSLARSLRMLLQSLVLGLGAYLVIIDQATPGVIIAGSILSARALAPIDLAIANWKMFIAARQSWRRLNELVAATRQPMAPLQLPPPRQNIVLSSVSVAPPGAIRLVVQDVSFSLKAGSGLGIVGPSASGKSSLLKAIIGVWAPCRGIIRIDGATHDQFSPQVLGPHVGYLPQDVELFSDTIARNIARFEDSPDSQKVIAAATAAGAHEMIKRLPNGYQTEIGQSGNVLSAGQRQRIGLARALYGKPFLVVLDEPNSNLDAEGEQALTRAILSVRARCGVVVVAAHRLAALDGVDWMLVMNDGRVQSYGTKEELLAPLTRRSHSPAPNVSSIAQGASA